MKKNNKKLKLLSLIFLIIFCLYFQTVVYSAISSNLTITGDAVARIRNNVRINKFRIHEVSDGVISSYEDFSKTYTMSNVTLPNSDSYIIYELVIGNYENVEMQLSNITGLPSNLTYELIDYNLHDMICDNTNKCFGGVEKTFYLKIKYATYNASGTNYNINLEYEFKEFSNTLMVGSSFKNTIPSTATHLVFTDEKPTSGVALTDVSAKQDMGVVGYLDGTTYKVSTRRTGVMPEANVDSSYMFNGKTLTNIDLSNLDTSNVVSMMSMFYNCSLLTEINFTNFNTSKVTTMESMFSACGKLTSLDLSCFDTSLVTNMTRMFAFCRSLIEVDVSSFDTSSVTTMYSLFADCNSLVNINVLNFNTIKTTTMYSMFRNCEKLVNLDLSSFNTSNVTSMKSMFAGCTNLTVLDISNFNTSNVKTMYYMFGNCKSLIDLDLKNFDTINVTDMYGMFQRCSKLTSLNLSNFDTSNVTTMQHMFGQNTSLNSIDISSFNTSKVINMYAMFSDNCNLAKIYVGSGWDTKNVTSSDLMFYSCKKLSNFDSNYIDVSKAYVGDGGYLSYPLKTVMIDNVAYEYEQGMTWEEWVNSEYNTIDACVNGEYIYLGSSISTLKYKTLVDKDDVIDGTLTYIFNSSGGAVE